MIGAIERQLELQIEELAEQKETEFDKVNYEKYSGVYTIAIRFFKKQRVLLYGGLALNELLPESDKFYSKFTLPDIDVFCVNAKRMAKQLVAEYVKAGYKYAAAKEALHEGTWKVFAEGLQVADVSDVSDAIYKRLYKGSIRLRKGYGIRIVSLDFLRLSLHAMLSQPYDVHRWSKVVTRMIAFYGIYPPKCRQLDRGILEEMAKSEEPLPPITDVRKVRAAMLKFIKANQYVLFGADAIEAFVKHDAWDYMIAAQMPYYQLLVDGDPSVPAQALVDVLKGNGMEGARMSKKYAGDIILPDHVFVTYKDSKTGKCVSLASFYATEMCLSYVQIGKLRFASVNTMCRMYMSLILGGAQSKHVRCIIDTLAFLQFSMFLPSYAKKYGKLYEAFVVQCYGNQSGLITMRRNQIERILK